MPKFVLLRTFYHKYDAEIAIGLLEEQGIQTLLQSDDLGGYREHLTLGAKNVRVLVPDEDLSAAEEIIKTLEESLTDEELKDMEEINSFAPQGKDSEGSSSSQKMLTQNEKMVGYSMSFGILLIVIGFGMFHSGSELSLGFFIMGIGSLVAGFLVSGDKKKNEDSSEDAKESSQENGFFQ